jgi:hypothetical protein
MITNKDTQLIWEAYKNDAVLMKAVNWLESIRQQGYVFAIHQTHPEVAKQIVSSHQGFRGGPTLGGTAAMYNPHQIPELLQNQRLDTGQTGGVHQGSQGVVVLMYPDTFRRPDDVSEHIIDVTQNGDGVVPDNYIAGYFDANENQFFRNPNFDPTQGILQQTT